MVSSVDSVRSYVGMMMSSVSSEPHQDSIGIGFVLCITRGQSPRLTKNSMSGRSTYQQRKNKLKKIVTLNNAELN